MSIFRRPSSGIAAGDAIPFLHDGVTHLFFLSSPAGTTEYPSRVRTTWQHVQSTDLVTWAEQPPAVEPGAGDSIDADGVWTGSVIERDETFYLFYTGHKVGVTNPQSICLATSADLVHFVKSDSNPLILPVDGCEPVDWRDPYVFWNDLEGRYWMLIAARRIEGPRWRRGVVILATSDDLQEWTVEREPLYEPGSTFCPECPEMWTLDGRWYLVYSRFSEQAGTVYRVADNPRGPFRIPERDELGGRRWYAAKSAPGADGRSRSFFGWIHDRGADGRWYWGGDFAAPREITAGPDGQLAARLPEQVASTYDTALVPVIQHDLSATGGFFHASVGDARLPSAYLADFDFTYNEPPAGFGISFRTDEELGGWFLAYDRVRRSVHLSHSPHPLDDFWADLVGRGQERREVDGPFVAEVRIATLVKGETRRASLLVEGPLVEIYFDDGQVLTHRIPVGGIQELGIFILDGDVTCRTDIRVPG